MSALRHRPPPPTSPSRPPGPSRRQLAVALGYEPGVDAAPVVLARGKGRMAERILAAAKKARVPIRNDRDLVEALARLDLGDVIPEELYLAVAEILAFIYRINRDARGLRLLSERPSRKERPHGR